MGQIRVDIGGSFPTQFSFTESAEEGGHAAALGRVVARLVDLLPACIELDHSLHEEGNKPPLAPFGRRRR